MDTTVGCTEISKKTIGPELGLCEIFTEQYPGETIYLVKCAFGSTSMHQDWHTSDCVIRLGHLFGEKIEL